MKYFDRLVVTLFVLILISCSTKKKEEKENIETSIDSLIQINFQDSNYLNLGIKDTVTPSGWKINYLVKNDASKYEDIYIKCSKENQQGIYTGGYLIPLRQGFVPYYLVENEYFIFFLYRCATDCEGLLVMNKLGKQKFIKYDNVYFYNLPYGQFIYSSEECFSYDENKYMLALKDLNNNKDFNIIFDNICTAINRGSCIDTVVFTEKSVTITTSLRKSIESDEYVVEAKTVEL